MVPERAVLIIHHCLPFSWPWSGTRPKPSSARSADTKPIYAWTSPLREEKQNVSAVRHSVVRTPDRARRRDNTGKSRGRPKLVQQLTLLNFTLKKGECAPRNVGKTFDTKAESVSTMHHRQSFVLESVLSVCCAIPVTWTALFTYTHILWPPGCSSVRHLTTLSLSKYHSVEWYDEWRNEYWKGCGRKWTQQAVERMRLELGIYKNISDEPLIC
jgi:hypothetical protein